MLVFSYGMNMCPEYMPGGVKVGPGRLFGWALEFEGFANIYRAPGSLVQGGVFQFADEAGALRMLDQREGYPHFYNRTEVQVHLPWDEAPAIVYYMNTRKGVHPPSPRYYADVKRGREFFGLPTHDLDAALNASFLGGVL